MKRDPVRLVDGGGRDLGGGATADLAVARVARDLQIARRAPHDYDAEAGLRRFAATIAGAGAAAGALAEVSTGVGASAGPAAVGGASVGSASVSSGAGAAVPLAGGAVSTIAAAPSLLVAKVLVVSMVAAGSVTTAVVVARGPSAPDTPRGTTSAPAQAPLAPPPSSIASAAPSASLPGEPATLTADPVESPPSASARPLPAASAALVVSPAPHPGPSVAHSVKPEVEHLAIVRQAGDPASALARAEEGHARFPRGVFWQEREAIAITSLVRLGRGDEARARARAFTERHPESPYATALRRLAGE